MGLSLKFLPWIFENCQNLAYLSSKCNLHNKFSHSEFALFYIKHNYPWNSLWYFCKINYITEHLGLHLVPTTIGLSLLHSWSNDTNCNGCYLDAKAVLQWCCTKGMSFRRLSYQPSVLVHHRESDAQLSVTALPDMRMAQTQAPSLSSGSTCSPGQLQQTQHSLRVCEFYSRRTLCLELWPIHKDEIVFTFRTGTTKIIITHFKTNIRFNPAALHKM